MTERDDEEKKISRVAAFIFSAHGDRAIEHARRLEAESAVPDTAARIRMEVERLVQADHLAMDLEAGPVSLAETGR